VTHWQAGGVASACCGKRVPALFPQVFPGCSSRTVQGVGRGSPGEQKVAVQNMSSSAPASAARAPTLLHPWLAQAHPSLAPSTF
jgi:hypothetical protein